MPQIAQMSEVFASQLFWLLVTFGIVFFVIGLGMVPKVQGTVDLRDRKIAEDLAAAERARAEADATEEAYRAEIERNRAEALKVTQAAKDASARETEQRIKRADVEIGRKVDAAEARIRSAADAASAEIENVAAAAARDIFVKLSGRAVSEAEAARAVKEVLGDG